jgi:hypothetical protein
MGDGKAVLESACKMGLEGIISKRLDKPYRSGRIGLAEVAVPALRPLCRHRLRPLEGRKRYGRVAGARLP